MGKLLQVLGARLEQIRNELNAPEPAPAQNPAPQNRPQPALQGLRNDQPQNRQPQPNQQDPQHQGPGLQA